MLWAKIIISDIIFPYLATMNLIYIILFAISWLISFSYALKNTECLTLQVIKGFSSQTTYNFGKNNYFSHCFPWFGNHELNLFKFVCYLLAYSFSFALINTTSLSLQVIICFSSQKTFNLSKNINFSYYFPLFDNHEHVVWSAFYYFLVYHILICYYKY